MTRHLTPPAFWQNRTPTGLDNLLVQGLSPLSALWAYAARNRYERQRARAYHSKMFVICVGNVTVGGTGKTPTALAIHSLLSTRAPHMQVCFITRGYKGDIGKTPVLLDAAPTARPGSPYPGDEALLLAQKAPVIVGRNRVEAIKLAESRGFDVAIMDDGFQNPSVAKDWSCLVFDGPAGLGNGRVMPAGPLREALDFAIPRAHAALVIGDDPHNLRAQLSARMVPVLKGQLTLEPHALTGSDARVVAFAGIGRPEKFFESLRTQTRLTLCACLPYPDHHRFTKADLDHLGQVAQREQAQLITTSKDWVRLPADAQARITPLPVTMSLETPDALWALLGPRLPARTP